MQNTTEYFLNTTHNTEAARAIRGVLLKTLLKKRLWHRRFPLNFVKFLRTPFLQNTSRRLLLFFEK